MQRLSKTGRSIAKASRRVVPLSEAGQVGAKPNLAKARLDYVLRCIAKAELGNVWPGTAKQSKKQRKEMRMNMQRRIFLKMVGLAGIPSKETCPIQYNPPHNSLQMARLNRMPERVYAEEWKENNVRKSWLNSGFTSLELILCPSGNYWCPPAVSERDAQVAASVIQWLGTNCGFHFMLRCEAEIKTREKKGKSK